MKNICVNFELWTIADGSYSPMKTGDTEVFSIGIDTNKVRIPTRNKKYLKQKKHSNYLFSGEVIYKTYTGGPVADHPVIVVDTGVFKFFVSGNKVSTFEVGQFIEGQGVLAIDSYEWMHMWDEDGAPHIYYDFTIEKIMGAKYSEEEINKYNADIENDEVEFIAIRPPMDDNLVELQTMDDGMSSVNYLELKMLKEAEPFKVYTLEEYEKLQKEIAEKNQNDSQ